MVTYLAKRIAIMVLLPAIVITAACGGDNPADDTGSSSSSSSASSSSSSSSSSSGNVDMSGGLDYQAANGITGGKLYAQFWAMETGLSLSNSKLTSQAQLDNIAAKEDFFSCAHCHGWDQIGRAGGNSNLAPTASRPRVADVDLAKVSEIASPQALFESIKHGVNRRSVEANLNNYDPINNSTVGDSMPDYSGILSDKQIWDIVKFLKEEALDSTALYDIVLLGNGYPQSRGFLNMGLAGNAAAGDSIFADNCSTCHGANGTQIMLDGGVRTVGSYIRSKPFEAQHIVKFGYLGSVMGPVLKDSSIDDIQDLFVAMRNEEKYPDTKTDAEPDPEPEPIDGELAFLRHCSGCHSGAGEGSSSPRYGDVTGASASLINFKIQNVPHMYHLKPDDPAQAVSLEEVEAIAEFLNQ